MKKAFKFIVSGGLAACTKLVVFLILFSVFHFWYLLASGIAFAISVVVGFYLQKYFTFENLAEGETHKQAIIFIFVSGLNLLVNIGVMYGFVTILRWNEIMSQVLTIGIIACWNFFMYQTFVFKERVSN